MGELNIALPKPGAKRHPTKIALFSTEDIPRGEPTPARQLMGLLGIPAAISINGEVMEFTVSEFVSKGQVIILDRAILEHDRWVTNATDGVTGLIAAIDEIEVPDV
jgi:hypothetical protein